MTLISLDRRSLADMPPTVERPAFDPASVRPGIVHLGLGGFHRAHMARYTHELMERRPEALEWGIVGAVLLPRDKRMVDALAPQDGLYTLVERNGEHERVRVIGSLAGVFDAGETSGPLLEILDRPAIRIVSLTVTENGYCLNAATKRLDVEHPLIRADLADPYRPKSAIGVIVEMLRRRHVAGAPPPTLLSCDNIQHNGEVLRHCVMDLAALRDEDLRRWIAEAVSFPSTMVDRITPVTSQADIERLSERYGVADQWPVVSEVFSQWVIEDRFPQGRPAWEEVGAQFVDDVAPYEFMKLRLLNASHLAVSGLGQLAGYVTIDQSLADPRIRTVMAALMDRETGPTLPEIPGVDIAAYKAELLQRFANVAIRDTVQRVNSDAPINLLVEPIRDRLKAEQDVTFLALALAAWFYRVRGADEKGAPLLVTHPLAALLREKALEGGPDPRPLLSIRSLFGELGDNSRLIARLTDWLGSLYGAGVQATLDRASQIISRKLGPPGS
ncbi:mannitol dehydrogenase [Alsobacter metallidurans]|uniref:Mannitol dehydrogenase n=1 Tax=Alsobacter metallidurans TaxID=340221 RepID=A0A917I6R3_9HYPH|nr:mannitol dehydrogenase family protein [Alsobacter metallidurans]GGH16310.1 mannitol dehydrogenase [Alsobacter metallidurans]